MAKKKSDRGLGEYHSSKQRIQDDYVSVLGSFETQLNQMKQDQMKQDPKKQNPENQNSDNQTLQEKLLNEKFKNARKKGNSISLFGALFKKNHHKIGRFGQKTISKEDDKGSVFEDLDKGASVKYFDPFGKIEEGRGVNTKPRDLNAKLFDSFNERSRKNEQLVYESDFERSQLTDDAKTHAYVSWYQKNRERLEEEEKEQLTEGEEKKQLTEEEKETRINSTLQEKFVTQFDRTKSFEPDYITEEKDPDPDEFEVVVAVQPPTEVYLDYNKQVTKETSFVMKSLQPDYKRILNQNVEKTAAYRELVEKGKKEAQEVGATYDPDQDPNIGILRAQTMLGIQEEQGHSFVRMVAKRDGESYSSYSFGFWPLDVTPGVGSVTMGTVKNPDPDRGEGSVIDHAFPVSYANYLRAAAKIRGVVGSQRSYSFLGYNCTSFAADIAKEAGVAIQDKDSSEDIRTFKYRSARIDSPYSLAKFIRMKNEEENTSTKDTKKGSKEQVPNSVKSKVEDMSFLEQSDKSMLDYITQLVDIKKDVEDGVEEKSVLQPDHGKNGRVVRGDAPLSILLEAYDGLQKKLKENPLFQMLQETFGTEKFEDKDKNVDYYALQLMQAILASTQQYLDDIDQKVADDLDGYTSNQIDMNIDKTYGLSGFDRQTAIRKFKIARKRDWMLEVFGYRTAMEYLSAVVQKPEMLAKAVMKLKENPIEGHGDIDLGNERIYSILKGKISAGQKWNSLNTRVLLFYIKNNPFFQEHIEENDTVQAFPVSPEEAVLRGILEMSRTFSEEKLLNMEEGDYNRISDLEKVMTMMTVQRNQRNTFEEQKMRRFITSVCTDENEMSKAIQNGLKFFGVSAKFILEL